MSRFGLGSAQEESTWNQEWAYPEGEIRVRDW
jgi:hypothetical protein